MGSQKNPHDVTKKRLLLVVVLNFTMKLEDWQSMTDESQQSHIKN